MMLEGLKKAVFGPSLPDWASLGEPVELEIDGEIVKFRKVVVRPSVVYPHFLQLMEIPKPTQYWLEVARRCFTQVLKETIAPTPLHLSIRAVDDEDRKWALCNFPPGDGADRGAVEFRRFYNRLLQKQVI